MIRDRLAALGPDVTPDQLRTALRVLADQGAVPLRYEGECAVVMLTRAGGEVAVGTAVMEGVMEPDPECPY